MSSITHLEKDKSKGIRIPFAVLAILCGLLAFLSWQYVSNLSHKQPSLIKQEAANCPPPEVKRYRMNDYKYTKPLLLMDMLNVNDTGDIRLNNIQRGLYTIITDHIQGGKADAVSVYLRDLNTGKFITINDEETYHPASMNKVR